MKQKNLFDMFSKKKEDKASSTQASQPSSEANHTEQLNGVANSSQANGHATSTQMIAETNNVTSAKKRKLLQVEEEEQEIQANTQVSGISASNSNLKTDSVDEFEFSNKKIKNEQSQSISDESNVKVPKAPKNMANLRKVTDPEYNSIDDAPFNQGEDVPFSFLTEVFDEVSKIKGEHSKEKIVIIISNMYRSILKLTPNQLILAYYFCILKIAPDYEANNILGVGNEILVKAISKAFGRSEKQIRDSNNQIGDLGKVAGQSKASQSTMDKFVKVKKKDVVVTLKRVMDTYRSLSKMKGKNSNNDREQAIMRLLQDAKEEEIKYLVRFIQGNLKIGAAEATMQQALVQAFVVHNYVDETKITFRGKNYSSYVPDFEKKMEKYEYNIKQAICEYPDYDALIKNLIKVGKNIDELLIECKITPGVPVKPMLAQPTKGISIVFKRFENMKFTCEYKYDGLRGQIHYHQGKCTIFSRNLENLTEQYPDIVDFVLESTKPETESFIIDSEIVAINPANQKILPFQKLSTRDRKNVDKNTIEISVCLYVFDILYYNGEPLIKHPLIKRREYIREHFKEVENKLKFAQHLDADTFEEVEGFLTESIKIGTEGLMVKTLEVNAEYQPSKRSLNWLKLKKDYLDTGLGDSFDLVPIAAYYGTGKRAGFYGSFLLACYNPDMERYETLCKTSTGLSDEQLESFHKIFSEHIIPNPLRDYCMSKDQEADVWFEPFMVWEIRGADIQISPVYTAAKGLADELKGVGLRFPRLMKVRTDKKPTEATDSRQIYDIYRQQASVMNDINFDDNDEIY